MSILLIFISCKHWKNGMDFSNKFMSWLRQKNFIFQKMGASLASLQSKQTSKTDFSLIPSISRSEKYEAYIYDNEPIVAEKHTTISLIDKSKYIHLRKVSPLNEFVHNIVLLNYRSNKIPIRKTFEKVQTITKTGICR